MQHSDLLLQNIYIQQLQHTSETSETLETYYCNMRFQRSIRLLLERIEACRHEARCRGVARRLPVWSSSVAQTSAQGQADGARPRLEARVRERASERLADRPRRDMCGVGASGAAQVRTGSVPRAEGAATWVG